MSRFTSTNEEFNKIKEGLINDIKIIQTQHGDSQKKLKIAEEIVQKTKVEYKKLNDEYIKLQKYKEKCENYINYLRDENSKIVLKLNKLYEEQQQSNKKQSNTNNYRRLRNLKLNPPQEEEEEEEEEDSTQEDIEEDITNQHLLVKKNKPPPNKIRKVKKGISKFI